MKDDRVEVPLQRRGESFSVFVVFCHGLARADRIRVASVLPWFFADQQLEQDEAERVHVAGLGDGSPGQLFGARVFGRQRAAAGARQLGRFRLAFHQQLGDAEIEQADLALAVDQNVRRLQITMHDPVVVRILDRAQHLQKQFQPRLQIQPATLAMRGDRLALDILQREI